MLINKRADSALGKAIAAFREEIKKLSEEDLVHNPFYLQAGFDLYYECFARFTTKDQSDLFCNQGIGCIQCYSPACDLQAFAQGLRYLVEYQKPFLGSFKFTHVWNSTSHLKINVKDFSGLGFDYWADGAACKADGICGGGPRLWPVGVASIPDFYRAKTTGFTNFVRGVQQPAASSVMACSFE